MSTHTRTASKGALAPLANVLPIPLPLPPPLSPWLRYIYRLNVLTATFPNLQDPQNVPDRCLCVLCLSVCIVGKMFEVVLTSYSMEQIQRTLTRMHALTYTHTEDPDGLIMTSQWTSALSLLDPQYPNSRGTPSKPE